MTAQSPISHLVLFIFTSTSRYTKMQRKVGESSWPQTRRHQKFLMQQQLHYTCPTQTHTHTHTLSPNWRSSSHLLQFLSLSHWHCLVFAAQLYLSLSQHLNMICHVQKCHSHKH